MSFSHVEQDLPPQDDFIAWGDRLAYFNCQLCAKTGHGWHPSIPGELCSCDGGAIVVYLGDFFANLAIAAGLSACDELNRAWKATGVEGSVRGLDGCVLADVVESMRESSKRTCEELRIARDSIDAARRELAGWSP